MPRDTARIPDTSARTTMGVVRHALISKDTAMVLLFNNVWRNEIAP